MVVPIFVPIISRSNVTMLSLPYRLHSAFKFPVPFVRTDKFQSFLGRVALVAQLPIVVKLSGGRSVGLCIGRSVCPVHCGKTADRIRMPFGIIGRTISTVFQSKTDNGDSIHIQHTLNGIELVYYHKTVRC